MNEIIEGCDISITHENGAQIASFTTYGGHKIKLRFHVWHNGTHRVVAVQLRPDMTQEELGHALDHPVCWKVSEPPAARPTPAPRASTFSEDF